MIFHSASKIPSDMGLDRWWRGQDLNLRPSGYEPDELPDCSTPRRSNLEILPSPYAVATRHGDCRPRSAGVLSGRAGWTVLPTLSVRGADGELPRHLRPPGPQTQRLTRSPQRCLQSGHAYEKISGLVNGQEGRAWARRILLLRSEPSRLFRARSSPAGKSKA